MTHAMIPQEQRMKGGLKDGLIRISVGLERARDIVEDVRNSLDQFMRRQGLRCNGGSVNINEKIEWPPAAAAARGIYIYTVMRGMMVRGYD